MRIQFKTRMRPAKTGVAVQAPEVGLGGAGIDLEDAVENLRTSLRVWVAGLKRQGGLAKALKRRGIAVTGDLSDSQVEVELLPPPARLEHQDAQ